MPGLESLDHILLTCSFANRCWEISKLHSLHTVEHSITQMILNLFDSMPTKELELICSLASSIWNHRNSVVWNNRFKTPSHVINEASSTLFQWQQAFSEKDGRSSFGCILIDETGSFMAGCGGQLSGALDPRVAEVLAFREALSWLKNMGRQQVYVELDSLNVVEALHSKTRDSSFIGTIIAYCSDVLKDLRSHLVYFVRRSANLEAH